MAAIAYWAHSAGIPHLDDLAACPDEPSFSKNASRKVSSSSGLDKITENLYWADVPMATDDGVRVMAPLPFCPFYEELCDEFQKSPTNIRNFASNLQTPNWSEHRLRKEVASEGVDVIGFGIFQDSATFRGKGAGTVDSLEVTYINIMGQRTRRTIASMPKAGCAGNRAIVHVGVCAQK